MTDDDRRVAEERRLRMAQQSRAVNRPRPVRVIEPLDRDTEMMAKLGFTIQDQDPGDIDWAAIARNSNTVL